MPELHLSLLGRVQIMLDGKSVVGFESNKARALLIYLAMEANRPHQRDALASLFWPSLATQAARTNLRQAIASVREVLGERDSASPFLLGTREHVQINQASSLHIDAQEFMTLTARCDQHIHTDLASCLTCQQHLRQAVELYQGRFLEQFFLNLNASEEFEDWIYARQERLHQLMLETVARLASCYRQQGANQQAQLYLQRLLELDPWREEAHRDLMRLHAQNGQRSAALAQFEQCRRVLEEELGVEPEAETLTLYEEIRALQPAPARQPLPREERVVPAAASSLPSYTTPFVGRQDELAELAELLRDPACRLITLVGPGGIGKSRLAIQLAGLLRESYADGVYCAPLEQLESSEQLAPALAAALGLPPSGEAPERQLLEGLRGRRALLLLDNFEHLRPDTRLIEQILAEAPAVSLLISSRERLNLLGEWLFPVEGLRYPLGDEAYDPAEHSAVELFVQSARRAGFRGELSPADMAEIGEACRLLEGTPLAIELAAPWLRVLGCAEIAGEIRGNPDVLSTPLRDVPARHQSVRALFERSWALLSPDEQTTLSRLSLFEGDFELQAAQQVVQCQLPLLLALADKSLLHRREGRRYALYALLRPYAAEKLAASGELEIVRRRYQEFEREDRGGSRR